MFLQKRLYVELWHTFSTDLKRDCIESLPNKWQTNLDVVGFFLFPFLYKTKIARFSFNIFTRNTKSCNLTAISKHFGSQNRFQSREVSFEMQNMWKKANRAEHSLIVRCKLFECSQSIIELLNYGRKQNWRFFFAEFLVFFKSGTNFSEINW